MLKNKAFKIVLCVSLAVFVVGMVFFSIFGFNKSVDYKSSYEITVGVDQNVGNSSAIVKQTAEKYFADKNVKFVSYSLQVMDKGARYIYKFDTPTGINENDLKQTIQSAIDNEQSLNNLSATASVGQMVPNYKNQTANLILVICVAMLIVFGYLFFTEKTAAATATIINSVISVLLFVALMGITRIPVDNTVGAFALAAFALAFSLSSILLAKLKEHVKLSGEDKPNYNEIACKVIKQCVLRCIFILSASLFVCALLGIFGSLYALFIGLQIFVASLCACTSAMIFTPIFWPMLKKIKK